MSNSAVPIAPASAVDFESPEDAELRAQVSKRVTVFSLTWIAYAAYYFGRMGFPVVKSTLQKTLGLTVGQLGWIDTGYLTAYAMGQFVSGFLGDRLGPRRLVGIGMLGVAVAYTLFGIVGLGTSSDIHQRTIFGLVIKVSTIFFCLFLASYILNGMFQSTGWPGTCKAMGSWLTPRERGTVMGLWSTCYQIGPILATWTATFLFAHWGWRWAFLGPAIIITIVGLMNLFFLPERAAEAPRAQGPDAADPAVEASDSDFSILRTPVLWSLGAAYFCLKLIRYSIFFWLPYYLNQVLHYPADVAGYRSVSFTVGGVVGSVVVGLISDRYFPGRRRVISAIMCAALAGALVLYIQVAPISMTINFVSMALIGFCLFGPDTIICGAAAQDIGGRHNVAKAAGFINGVGSIGAIFQGVVTAKISTSRFGWNGLFYFFVLLALLSSIALLIGKRPAAAATNR
jgi:sugar phosphate permease